MLVIIISSNRQKLHLRVYLKTGKASIILSVSLQVNMFYLYISEFLHILRRSIVSCFLFLFLLYIFVFHDHLHPFFPQRLSVHLLFITL